MDELLVLDPKQYDPSYFIFLSEVNTAIPKCNGIILVIKLGGYVHSIHYIQCKYIG